MNADGSVKREVDHDPDLIPGVTVGGTSAYFGVEVALLGDIDGDGVQDIAVGANGDESVTIIRLNTDGSIKGNAYELNDANTSFSISDAPYFGYAVSDAGDWNNDGIPDVMVGAYLDDDGGTNRGAVYIIYLNEDGSEKGYVKLSDTQ